MVRQGQLQTGAVGSKVVECNGEVEVIVATSESEEQMQCANRVVAPTEWASHELVHPIPSWSSR